MKRLGLTVVFLAALASGAFAGSGSITLYAQPFDGISTPSCSGALVGFDTLDVGIYYSTNSGPEMGRVAEFCVKFSVTKATISNVVWSPAIGAVLGNVSNGVAISAPLCIGGGQTYVFLGVITVQDLGENGRFTATVQADPEAVPPGILVTTCQPNDPAVVVTGGTFVFNGSCNVGVENRTWGAIKDLYR